MTTYKKLGWMGQDKKLFKAETERKFLPEGAVPAAVVGGGGRGGAPPRGAGVGRDGSVPAALPGPAAAPAVAVGWVGAGCHQKR